MPRYLLLLGLLALTGCGSSGRVTGYGISVRPPAGWQAQITRGAATARGDGLSLLLYEDTPDAQWSPPLEYSVYKAGKPRVFNAREFNRSRNARRNFTIAGRYFDLFVHRSTAHMNIAALNQLLESLRIESGDFYPGGANPPRFRPAAGWRTQTVGTIPNGTSMFSVTIATTGHYDDPLNAAPPIHTLARLKPGGTVIDVLLTADNRFPPPSRGTRLRLSDPHACTWGDGPPSAGVSCTSGSFVVASEYTATVTIIYGRKHPTAAQRANAQTELRRLVLPRWVDW